MFYREDHVENIYFANINHDDKAQKIISVPFTYCIACFVFASLQSWSLASF